MTLTDLANKMFEYFKDELKLNDYDISDEDPSFVAITLYSDEYADEDEDIICEPIKQWLAKQNLILYDDYDERDIQYKISSIQFDGDSYSIFLKER